MKAIVVHEYGTPEVMIFEDAEIPVVGPSQILVKICAAGVNPVDTYIRSGQYAVKPELPYTPGKDGAGVIESIGENVEGLRPGDRVYLAGSISGTYAEYALCDENQVHRLPDNTTFAQGAGLFVPYGTAWRALFEKARARAGETVLVHGASGGVGIAAIQWAKQAGLTVVGTAGSPEGLDLVRELGADYAFDHSSANYLSEIQNATGGVDIVLEMLANVNLVRDFEVLKMFGRIIVIGNRGSLDFNPRLTMGKEASIHGLALFNASEETMAEIHRSIFDGLRAGYLNPVIRSVLPLSEAVRAHHEVIESRAFGKIVLDPRSGSEAI